MAPAQTPISFERRGPTEVVRTSLVSFGHEDRPPHAQGWQGVHATADSPLLAFSLVPVRIRFRDDPVVLSPAVVATPGTASAYTRSPICPEGQRTVWMFFRDDTLTQIAARYDPEALGRPETPLGAWTAPVDPRAALIARKLASAVFAAGATPDPLVLEECVVRIAERSLRTAFEARRLPSAVPRRPAPRTRRGWSDAVNAACEYICINACDPIGLAQISDAAELSPGYLCRVFRDLTGMSVHEYTMRVRVLRAVDELPAWRGRLAALALRCGFSSHAHLVTAFRRLLGATPTQVSDRDARAWLALLRPMICPTHVRESRAEN